MKACITKEKVIKFGDIKIQKQKSHQCKRPIPIKNIDINKSVVSNKVSCGKKRFKYFIGYKDAKKNRPLCIFPPKMSACRRDVDETKYISFLIRMNYYKNSMKFGKKSKIASKKNLIVNQYTMKKI